MKNTVVKWIMWIVNRICGHVGERAHYVVQCFCPVRACKYSFLRTNIDFNVDFLLHGHEALVKAAATATTTAMVGRQQSKFLHVLLSA